MTQTITTVFIVWDAAACVYIEDVKINELRRTCTKWRFGMAGEAMIDDLKSMDSGYVEVW